MNTVVPIVGPGRQSRRNNQRGCNT